MYARVKHLFSLSTSTPYVLCSFLCRLYRTALLVMKPDLENCTMFLFVLCVLGAFTHTSILLCCAPLSVTWFYDWWQLDNWQPDSYELGHYQQDNCWLGPLPRGCIEVRWCPGQETSLAPPCSNLRSLGQMFYSRGGQQVDRDRLVDRRVSIGRSHLILHWIDKIPKMNTFQLIFLFVAFYDIFYLYLYYRPVDRELSRNFVVDRSRRQRGHPCAIVKKVLATLLKLVGGPSDSAPKALCPICLPFVTLLNCLQDNRQLPAIHATEN